jgi:hypothetical protein
VRLGGLGAVLEHPEGLQLELTAEPATGDARAATEAAIARHLARLGEPRLIDVAEAALAGSPGTRLLIHHVDAAGATCLEEWRAVLGGYLVTLAARCPALAYDAAADAHAAAAASLRVER